MGRGRHPHGPPWWPEGEPWPPRAGLGAAAWGGWGRRMFRKAAFFAVLVLLGAVASGAVLAAGLAGLAGGDRAVAVAATLLVLGGFIFLAGTAFRTMWGSVGRLIASAGRLADGDYGVRVESSGPPPIRAVIRSFNQMAARLDQADERRRRLLADLSHELRNPLSIIQGSLEALLDGVHPPDREHLASLLEETRVMGGLLEDLRTLALAEAGRLPLHREPTGPGVLISEAVAAFRPQAEAAGVEVVIEVPADLPPVEVDPARIRAVIANLVGNALRYMPEGGRLTVRAGLEEGWLRIAVEDTGPGISEERLDSVFERFVKSDDSTGSGLGLTIARDLVEAHGGQIRARSRPGAGSLFEFTLPIEV
ncbi:MAG: HAMP domain-containing sensor histidine kinase [Acidimicrobiia bacterium]